MPLARLLSGPRSVFVAGRGFTVRPPSVRTYFVGLGLFGAEIAMVRMASEKIEGGAIAPAVALGFMATRPDDLRALLSTCVVGELAGLSASELCELALHACEMFTPSAVNEMFGPPAPDASIEGDDCDLVLRCAEGWGCRPSEVLDEPLDLFVSFVLARSQANEAKARKGEMVGTMAAQRTEAPLVGGPQPYMPKAEA